MINEGLRNREFTLAFLHGDPGVGKGTVSKGLMRELPMLGIPVAHISSGDTLREVAKFANGEPSKYPNIEELTEEVGDDIHYMFRRELVPAPTILRMVFKTIEHAVITEGTKLVFVDGGMRTIPQHNDYSREIDELDPNGLYITRNDILIDTVEDIKINRLLGRVEGRVDDGSRKDTLDRYNRIKSESDPMIALIRRQIASGELRSTFFDINANQTENDVLQDVLKIFNSSESIHQPSRRQHPDFGQQQDLPRYLQR